jgi:P-type Ca2+ transporter type 2C
MSSMDVHQNREAGELAQIVRHARAARRLRLVVPGLLHSEMMARRLESSLLAQEGVEGARANPGSGRVLILYRADAPVFDRLERLAAELSGSAGNGGPVPERALAPRAAGGDWHHLETAAVLERWPSSGSRDGGDQRLPHGRRPARGAAP